MLYETRHRTTYEYDGDVSLSHHLTRLTPRELPHQRLREHRVETAPTAAIRSTHTDHFGNQATFLTITGPHRTLEITATSVVEITPALVPSANSTPPWETVRDGLASESTGAPMDAVEFALPSPLAPQRHEFAAYAQESFPADSPVLDAVANLMARIHQDFAFDPRATTVTTPVSEFLKLRRGVCQDFAHFTIACLRSTGLSARYVSGYLETLPPPGQPRLVGADASHAWASVWCGAAGWIDLDPTNNLLPSKRHITVAFGRDFSDVSPVRGVIVGSGTHRLNVAVDVAPLAAE